MIFKLGLFDETSGYLPHSSHKTAAWMEGKTLSLTNDFTSFNTSHFYNNYYSKDIIHGVV